MISIIDYGAGNLCSIQNAFDKIDAAYRIVSDAVACRESTRIVLPGVGNFGQMMRALDRLDLREPLRGQVRKGVPFLGICLGLQALFEGSAEAPEQAGLGIFTGRVERFPLDARVPHMGWNDVTPASHSRLLPAGVGAPYFYFANSYFVPLQPETTGSCCYAHPFTAVLEYQNICGVQFHPEKSGPAGLALLRRFIDL